jgi:hypothetical protein
MRLFETSAKTSFQITQAFSEISKNLMVKRDKEIQEKKLNRKKNHEDGKKLGKTTPVEDKKDCC